MSVLGKEWRVKNSDSTSPLLHKLLNNRNLKTEDEIECFLNPSAERDFHDPFLMEDMEKAVARISRAIENKERIMIFGDYDVDGITGSAILMRALRTLEGNVSYRLPHRIEDGYGLREKFIQEFKKLDVKVVITVDNGISCYDEVEVANKLGIDVIISDHHTVPEKIPNAIAILHPKLPGTSYPFSELTGSAVALKLAQALFLRLTKNPQELIAPLMDLACMGTITDFGELKGENRFIVKAGLRALENTRWPGLSRLKEMAGVKGEMSTHDIGFLLGPRINAAGRISHASHALTLLLHEGTNSEPLAKILEDLNRKRQRLTEELMEIADVLAAAQQSDSAIVIHHPKFHCGVIGLLASKLVEKFSKPVIVMEEREKVLVGSCRSVPGVNIVQALTAVSHHLSHFGGHAMAAGFEVSKKNLKAFQKEVKVKIAEQMNKTGAGAEQNLSNAALHIECEILHREVSMDTVKMIANLAPFGQGNDVPRFLLRGVPVLSVAHVGKERKHVKINTRLNSSAMSIIGFRLGQFISHLQEAKTVDIVCELEEDRWNGRRGIQLKLVDFKV